MRKLTKMVALEDSRKELLLISNEVDTSIPTEDQFDADGNGLSGGDIDGKWADLNRRTLMHRAKRAMECLEDYQEKETPLALLEGAFKNLTKKSFSIESISQTDYSKARRIAVSIQKRANEIEHELYDNRKKPKASSRKR
jgi:hypothetical protein